MTPTLKHATKMLSAFRIALRKSNGEYRVSYFAADCKDTEASAAYTDCIIDAIGTGMAMAAHRDKANAAK